MAKKTEYQKQADKRTKNALRLRARFDGRIRKYAQQLVAAVAGAVDARNRLNRINQLYGVDLSTETLLAHSVRVADFSGQLAVLLRESSPGEEVQLFNPTSDGNGRAALALEAVFGEVPAALGVPVDSPTGPSSGIPVALALTLTSFTHSYSAPYDNITLQVASPVASDTSYDLTFDAPGSSPYPNLALNEAITLSLSPVTPGQAVTMTAVAASGARLTHTFIVDRGPQV